MKQVFPHGLTLWQFDKLATEPGIDHFVTGRKSNAHGSEFTLSYSSVPDRAEIDTNRRLLATAMNVDAAHLYFPSQVHKTRIVNVTSATRKEELQETDALITAERGRCIAVMSADCVPIVVYDKKNQAVGAIHSGWRGTVARILEKTLATMHQTFGTRGEHVLAGIGPSVSQDAYEVGEEVVHEVSQAFDNHHQLLVTQSNNKARLDLWKANIIQLREFGVPEANIEVSDLCTVKHNHHFFSARRGDTGRFAAGIMLRD